MTAMNHAATLGCLWMLLSTILTGIVLIAAELCGGRVKEHWPAYWLAALLVAVIPILAVPIFYLAPVGFFTIELNIFVALHNPLSHIHGLFSRPLVHFTVAVFIVYLGDAAFKTVTLIRHYRRALAVARTAVALPSGAAFNLPANIRIVSSGLTVSTYCIGGAQPTIVLAERVGAQMSQEQLGMILKHELAHLNRGDPVLFLALQFLEALFWFDPFTRRLSGRIRMAAEIVCDEAALSGGTSREIYANALVRCCEIAASEPVMAAAFGEPGHQLRIRLSRILKSSRMATSSIASPVLLGAALAVGGLSTALAVSTAHLISLGESTATSNALAWRDRGLARAAMGEIDQAALDAAQATRLDPN